MSPSYAMVPEEGSQDEGQDSFVGGRPKLPAGVQVPRCTLCGASQTFFFQIAFPPDQAWAGHSIAVFACTACADENRLIPEMVSGRLAGTDVSAAFLAAYQRNFRFLVFKTEETSLVAGYSERVRFRPVRLTLGAASSLGQVGGSPHWISDDETPGSVASSSPVFLLQLSPDVEFETVAGAPRQMEIGLDGTPEESPDEFYRLFIGNATYLFGPSKRTQDGVYAVTQVE